MADESIHELTAAYALDALDESDSEAYERHLAQCERCRDELAALSGAAAALAYAVDAPPPPPALRGRILDAARDERQNVVPLRRRRPFQLVAAAAAVAACAAIGLGVWAGTLNNRLDRQQQLSAQRAQVLAITGNPASRTIALQGGKGRLVVDQGGRAALFFQQVPAAPSGKTYEAWVIVGKKVQPAGLFRGGADTAVPLEQTVPRGATVGVTVERAGGANA